MPDSRQVAKSAGSDEIDAAKVQQSNSDFALQAQPNGESTVQSPTSQSQTGKRKTGKRKAKKPKIDKPRSSEAEKKPHNIASLLEPFEGIDVDDVLDVMGFTRAVHCPL